MKIESLMNKKGKESKIIKYENIEETENFHILTNYDDDFIINSKDDAEALLEILKNSKYNKELAKFFSKFENDIKDLTEE